MKRKLAFLLAAVMILSLLPVSTASARTVESLSRDNATVYGSTLLIEPDSVPGGKVNREVQKNGGDVEYVLDGNDLILTVDGAVREGDRVRIELENAEFMFRADSNFSPLTTNAFSGEEPLSNLWNRDTRKLLENERLTVYGGGKTFSWQGFGDATFFEDNPLIFRDLVNATYDRTKGVWWLIGDSKESYVGRYVRYAGTFGSTGTVAYAANNDTNQAFQAGKLEVPYMLSVDAGNNSAATLTVLGARYTNDWDHYFASEGTMYYYGKPQEVEGVTSDELERSSSNGYGLLMSPGSLDPDDANGKAIRVLQDKADKAGKYKKNDDYYGRSAKDIFIEIFGDYSSPPTTYYDVVVTTTSPVGKLTTDNGLWSVIEGFVRANGTGDFWTDGYPYYNSIASDSNGKAFSWSGSEALTTAALGIRNGILLSGSATATTYWGFNNTGSNPSGNFKDTGSFGPALYNANNILVNGWNNIRQVVLLLVGGDRLDSTEMSRGWLDSPRMWLNSDWVKTPGNTDKGTYITGDAYDYLENNIGQLDTLIGAMKSDMEVITDILNEYEGTSKFTEWLKYVNSFLPNGGTLSYEQGVQVLEWAMNMQLVYDNLSKMTTRLHGLLDAVDLAINYYNGVEKVKKPDAPSWWHNSYRLYLEGKNTFNDFEASVDNPWETYDPNDKDATDQPGQGFISVYRGGRWEIRIPLVSRVQDEGYAFVVIPESSVGGNISATRLAYANAAGGGTKTIVVDPETARTEFPVDLKIRENRFGSLKTGAFRVTAPAGFEWSTFKPYSSGINVSTKPEGDNVGIRINGALRWRSGFQWYGRPTTTYYVDGENNYYAGTGPNDNDPSNAPDYYLGFPPTGGAAPSYGGSYMSGIYTWTNAGAALSTNTQNGSVGNNAWAVDRSTLIVILSGLKRSGQDTGNTTPTVGELVIENLKLVASDTAPWGDIWLEVENLSNNESGVSKDYKVLAGTRVDWTISLTTITDVPTLYSGRYSTNLAVINRDKDHEAAKVRFKENSVNAWWAGRVTNFNLNEQAKFRKVKFEDVDEMGSGGDYLKDAENVDIAKMFYNDGRKYSKLTFSGNIMTLQNFQVNANKRAKFDFTSYISIQPGYEGPITLGVDGSAIPTENPPPAITIANALSIVKVTTLQKDLLIGYQWQRTENITLNETSSGILRKDEVVRLSITDHVTNDITFGPDMQYTVNPRGVKISNWSTTATGMDLTANSAGTGGTIQFSIGAASAEATEIEISNISVKIDRTVPVSNQRPYDVVVWGNAVAANYAFENERNKAAFDTFTTFGPNLLAPYLKIVSSANDASTILTQEVRVPVGQNYYLVNGISYDMPDAQAYLDATIGTVFVPLRFVTQAFGLQPDQIVYDKGVITIIHPTRIIQFTIGEPVMIINGTSIPILNALGQPVSPQTKESLTPGFVRSYVPFRALGDAFGIPVSWDGENQVAIYNEGADTFFEAPNLTNRNE